MLSTVGEVVLREFAEEVEIDAPEEEIEGEMDEEEDGEVDQQVTLEAAGGDK